MSLHSTDMSVHDVSFEGSGSQLLGAGIGGAAAENSAVAGALGGAYKRPKINN